MSIKRQAHGYWNKEHCKDTIYFCCPAVHIVPMIITEGP